MVGTFVQSLNPYYDPPNSQPPPPEVAGSDAGIDPWGRIGQISNFLKATALAGRAIAVCAALPPEVNNLLGYLANLSVAGRFASDQLQAFNAGGGSMPEPDTHRENTPDEAANNTKDKTRRKASQNLRQKSCKSTTQLPNTPLALGALVGLSAVGAASASAPDTDWVKVSDANKLGKICHDTKSCSGKYRLTDDIDGSQLNQSIGSETIRFTGILDGNSRKIGSLSQCLVKHLYKGRIENLTLGNPHINSTAPAGVVACEMSGNAMVSNIQVEGACVATTGKGAHAAIGVGKVNDGGTIKNMTALNCDVTTSGKEAYAGIGAGYLDKGNVTDTTAVSCTVSTSGRDANAGIGVGKQEEGAVTNTIAVSCRVSTSGSEANAGIGAGISDAGAVSHTAAINCTVATSETLARAAIGVGSNEKAEVTDTIAVNCRVKTSEKQAHAGIGAGFHGDTGMVTDTTAVNCSVATSGDGSKAGIGAGWRTGTASVANTMVFDSTVNSTGIGASADIRGGDDSVIICHASINGVKQLDFFRVCSDKLVDNLCKNIDRSLVTPDCQVVNDLLPSSITEAVTAISGTAMNASSPDSATMATSPTTVATAPGTTFSIPSSATFATFATSTSSMASLDAATKAIIALGTVIFVLVGALGVITYRYCNSLRSPTNAGRNREDPTPPPPNGRPCAEGQLSTPPRDHYQPLSLRPRNTRPLPPSPQSRYQTLTFRQGNTATGGSNPLVDNDPHPLSGIPVYQELTEFECNDNHGQPVADGQAGIAAEGSNSVANTGKPTRPDSPVYHVLTEKPESEKPESGLES